VSVPVVRFTVRGAPRDASDEESFTAGASGVGEGRPYTVVYDGHCKVCGRMVGVLRVWDRSSRLLEIVPSQLGGVQARFPWIPAQAYVQALQLIGPGGQTWQGEGAIERLIDIMPRGRLISWIFKLPFVHTLADRFYRWFARNRYRLGCGDHCTVNANTTWDDEPAATR
jgi:predicted DCC family thiol-disulfide oxidoreductase YuxK